MTTVMGPNLGSHEPVSGHSIPKDSVVVLGASNVSRGLVDITETLRGFLARPLDFLLAPGHGRSYGASSSVLWRTLPGLTECDLWTTLSGRDCEGERVAVLTDIGNDLLYGATAQTTLEWVEICAERLNQLRCRLIVTELPLSSVRNLGYARFLAARAILFPGSPLQYEGLLQTCEFLNSGLHRIAKRFQGTVVSSQPHWYGVDPIHIRTAVQRAAWSELLSSLKRCDDVQPQRFSKQDRRRIRAVRHARRKWFGRVQQRPQPSVVLEDGSAISMF